MHGESVKIRSDDAIEQGSDVFVVSKEIYLALHPIEQIMAQALQRVGEVKIMYDDPKFKKS